MARIAGVELPENKKILFALPYVYGMGRSLAKKILEKTKVDPDKRVKQLNEKEILALQKEVESYPIEEDLKK